MGSRLLIDADDQVHGYIRMLWLFDLGTMLTRLHGSQRRLFCRHDGSRSATLPGVSVMINRQKCFGDSITFEEITW
jgi:hypothetical protein